MKSDRVWHFLKIPAVIALVLILAGLYWVGAVEQLVRVNTDKEATDQSAYMEYARTMYESNYTVVGGRNRMPVYPFLQSLFYRPGMTDEAFFTTGKYVNLVLSLVLLAGIALIFRHCLRWLHALTLLLIVAFTVFIFKAGYFQVELLFYFMNFCLFWVMWRLLQQTSWQLAIVTGIVAGLAHLTKASILPGLGLFLALAAIKWGGKWGWTTRQSRHPSSPFIPTKALVTYLLPLVLVGVSFLLTVFPYINTSKQLFGHYFYNVNSTFYIWYDSWEEAKQGTRAHGDRVGWPAMPPEEIPSMAKYLREHTGQQMVNRVVEGAQAVLFNVVHSYGYLKYIEVYFALLLLTMLYFWRRVYQAVCANPILYLFLALYFGVYLLLCFWYAPIASGNRIILAQFLPFLFTISYGLHKLLLSSQLTLSGYSVYTLDLYNFALLLVVLGDIYLVLTERVGTMYGGL